MGFTKLPPESNLEMETRLTPGILSGLRRPDPGQVLQFRAVPRVWAPGVPGAAGGMGGRRRIQPGRERADSCALQAVGSALSGVGSHSPVRPLCPGPSHPASAWLVPLAADSLRVELCPQRTGHIPGYPWELVGDFL